MPKCTRETTFDAISSRLDLGAKKMNRTEGLVIIFGVLGIVIELLKVI